MLTTGFKFFFSLFAAFIIAAVIYGYTSGGTLVGPVSFGWKGSVGDHIGYGVLVSLAAINLAISVMMTAFRDADATAQAGMIDSDTPLSEPNVKASWWPTICALGAGAAILGLVLHPAIFILGLAVMALTGIEWTIEAWADRATGDTTANRKLRNRLMLPIEIPIISALVLGIIALTTSRMLLTVSKEEAVVVGGVISTLIFVTAAIYVTKPGMGRRIAAWMSIAASVLLLVGGILAAARGERDFHKADSDSTHELFEEENEETLNSHSASNE